MSEREQLLAVARGRVQGVGFRWSVQRAAQRLGLGGYAANRPDGSVEVVAEGPPGALDELENLLRSGPGAAEVVRLDAERRAATGAFSRFATK